MFFAGTISVGSVAAELTNGIDTADRYVLVVRVLPSTLSAGAFVRIGTSGVASSSGFSLDANQPQVTFTIEGDKVYGIIAGGGSGATVDVLAYSA